jgi:hypothetical protein
MTKERKLELLLGSFDYLNEDNVISPLVLFWMNEAVELQLYSHPVEQLGDQLSALPDASNRQQGSPARSSMSSISDSSDSLLGTNIEQQNSNEDSSEVTSNSFDQGEAQKFGYLLRLLPENFVRIFDALDAVDWDVIGYKAAEGLVQSIITAIQGLPNVSSVHERESVLQSFRQNYENNYRAQVEFLRLALDKSSTRTMANDSITSSEASVSRATASTGQTST